MGVNCCWIPLTIAIYKNRLSIGGSGTASAYHAKKKPAPFQGLAFLLIPWDLPVEIKACSQAILVHLRSNRSALLLLRNSNNQAELPSTLPSSPAPIRRGIFCTIWKYSLHCSPNIAESPRLTRRKPNLQIKPSQEPHIL